MRESCFALEFRNLKKVYPNGVEALKGINLSIKQGDFFALLGANGAGKTTAISVLTDLIKKTDGEVYVLGVNLDKDSKFVKRSLGVVPQEFNFNLFEMVLDIIVQQAGYYGVERSVAIPRALKILKKLDLYEKRFHQAKSLSGGMKRRLMIARALVHQPKVLILDEPTAGVDVELRRSMWNFIKQLNMDGTTVILTTHYLEEVEALCNNVAILHQGELIINTSVKAMINSIDIDEYIIELGEKINIPYDERKTFTVEQLDPLTLSIRIANRKFFHEVFKWILDNKLHVLGMRPRSNRLESFLLEIMKK